MEQTEFEKKVAENKKILDKLNLPKPEIGEDIWHYTDRVEDMFAYIILPEDYGDLFHYLDADDIGDYLGERFDMRCEEVIRYIMT